MCGAVDENKISLGQDAIEDSRACTISSILGWRSPLYLGQSEICVHSGILGKSARQPLLLLLTGLVP